MSVFLICQRVDSASIVNRRYLGTWFLPLGISVSELAKVTRRAVLCCIEVQETSHSSLLLFSSRLILISVM